MVKSTYNVIGIGEGKIDYLAFVNDEKTRSYVHSITLGEDKFIKWSDLETLINNLDIQAKHAGGSIANTLSVLGKFGQETFMIGYEPHDPNQIFYSNAQAHNIKCSFHSHQKQGKGNLLALIDNVTKDRSFLNADYSGTEILPDIQLTDEEKNTLKQAKFILLEGYDWLLPTKKELHVKIANDFKHEDQIYVLSLSDVSVLRKSGDILKDYLDNHVDMIVGNLAEYEMLLGKKGLDNTLQAIEHYTKEQQKVIILTASNLGAFLVTPSFTSKIDTSDIKLSEIVNTNGAGDNFLAGFINALLNADIQKTSNITDTIAQKALTAGHRQAGNCLRSEKTVP